MENPEKLSCQCSSCPGVTCTCGCQSAPSATASATTCNCATECNCGPDCACEPAVEG